MCDAETAPGEMGHHTGEMPSRTGGGHSRHLSLLSTGGENRRLINSAISCRYEDAWDDNLIYKLKGIKYINKAVTMSSLG